MSFMHFKGDKLESTRQACSGHVGHHTYLQYRRVDDQLPQPVSNGDPHKSPMSIFGRRLLAVASIGGGFSGASFTAATVLQPEQPTVVLVVNMLVAAIYLVGVWGGVGLLEHHRIGNRILFWYYLAQVPIVTSPFISFYFSSGFFPWIRIGTDGFNWAILWGSKWELSVLHMKHLTFSFGLNLFSLWAVWFLYDCRKHGYPPLRPNDGEPRSAS